MGTHRRTSLYGDKEASQRARCRLEFTFFGAMKIHRDAEVSEILDLGARGYIHKPFSSRELPELLSELVPG